MQPDPPSHIAWSPLPWLGSSLFSQVEYRARRRRLMPQPVASVAELWTRRDHAVGGAQVYIERPSLGTQSRPNGEYVLQRVPAGTHTLRVRMLGLRPEAASVQVEAGQRTIQDFSLRRDPLQLQTMVVTGTQSPRLNLDASVAVTTLTATEVQAAAPRSTTEMLRYVPGFTRVESRVVKSTRITLFAAFSAWSTWPSWRMGFPYTPRCIPTS